MAIDEINAKGGVMGRKLEPVVVDPASNWPLFAEKSRQLLAQDKVAVVFGCWTSVSRKSVLPVFKELNGLLFYPVQYEGEELEKNVFYTGAAPNQQAIPAVEYLMSEDGGGAKRFVLLGTDYVYPRTTNKILRAFLHSKGVKDSDIDEVYTPFGHSDYQTIVANIKKFATGGKTAVISTINGDSNVPFYKELGNAGLKATDVPVVAFSVGEEELRGVDTKPLVGHLAAWNYFESIKTLSTPTSSPSGRPTPRPEPAQRRDRGHQRSDGGDLHRHPHVEAGRRAGQEHGRGQGHRGHGRPDVQLAQRLRDHDGQDQPPPAQAGVHRRDQGRRPVQRGLEEQGSDPRPALEPVYPGQRRQAGPLRETAAMRNAAIARYLRRLLLALFLAWPALPVAAAGVGQDLLAPLAGDDTDARLRAIAALGALPGGEGAAVLRALGADQLYAAPDGRVLIGDGARATDPASGAALELPAGSASIGINNRLRRAIEAALAGAHAADAGARLAAARRLQQTNDPSRLPLIAQALATERDPTVRAALEIAQARLELQSADPAARRHAVELLGRSDDAAFRPVLAALTQQRDGAHAEPDAGVRGPPPTRCAASTAAWPPSNGQAISSTA